MGGRRGTKTVNVPFLIHQSAFNKVPLLTIQCALEVPFFYKVIMPFFVPGVNTTYNGFLISIRCSVKIIHKNDKTTFICCSDTVLSVNYVIKEE